MKEQRVVLVMTFPLIKKMMRTELMDKQIWLWIQTNTNAIQTIKQIPIRNKQTLRHTNMKAKQTNKQTNMWHKQTLTPHSLLLHLSIYWTVLCDSSKHLHPLHFPQTQQKPTPPSSGHRPTYHLQITWVIWHFINMVAINKYTNLFYVCPYKRGLKYNFVYNFYIIIMRITICLLWYLIS